jgi:pimeloyl-ACP methyl ester carboxylesterase
MEIQKFIFDVPGAQQLPYAIQGKGPILLLIPGGEGGKEGFESISSILSDRYTVVTYDRRGAPGTKVHDPSESVALKSHSEDARLVLESVSGEPAYVFGSSAGALVGLDLIIRYPQKVISLIAHEPPVEGILDEFDKGQQAIYDAFKEGGVMAAMRRFSDQINANYDELEPGVKLPPRNPQDAAIRAQALLRYTFPAVHEYRLDIDSLKSVKKKVFLACGANSHNTRVGHCVEVLANLIGTKVIEFPSHHVGYISHPNAFAKCIDDLLNRNNHQ